MLDLSYIIQDMTNTNTDNKTEERKNRFTGQSIMLTKEESIIHDRIFINELAATLEDKVWIFIAPLCAILLPSSNKNITCRNWSFPNILGNKTLLFLISKKNKLGRSN